MAELNDIVKSRKQPVERSALSDRNISGVFSALSNHLKTIRFFPHDRASSSIHVLLAYDQQGRDGPSLKASLKDA
jgi:hypothetical protein